MAVTGVLTSGQWGYPIQGLGSYGGAEEKKPSFMRFTSEHRTLPVRGQLAGRAERPTAPTADEARAQSWPG